MLLAKPVVQKLGVYQRREIMRHLQRLSPQDRRLRFGIYMSDAAVERYVNGIDFSRDRIFGIFEDDLALSGVAHLALEARHCTAELGLSVDAACRGRGYGFALLSRCKLEAMTLGYRTLFMHCLAENKIMIHLARKTGMSVVTRQGETDANLALEDATCFDFASEFVGDQLALIE